MSMFKKFVSVLKKIDSAIDKADKVSTDYCCTFERKVCGGKTIDEHIHTGVEKAKPMIKEAIPIVKEKVSRAQETVSTKAKTVSVKARSVAKKTGAAIVKAPIKVTVGVISTAVVDIIKLSFKFIKQVAIPTCVLSVKKLVKVSK